MPRRDRLRALKLGLVGHEVAPDQRDPVREREALLGEDVAADDERDDDEADDEREVARVLADRLPHGVAPSAGPDAAPLRLGSGWV